MDSDWISRIWIQVELHSLSGEGQIVYIEGFQTLQYLLYLYMIESILGDEADHWYRLDSSDNNSSSNSKQSLK